MENIPSGKSEVEINVSLSSAWLRPSYRAHTSVCTTELHPETIQQIMSEWFVLFLEPLAWLIYGAVFFQRPCGENTHQQRSFAAPEVTFITRVNTHTGWNLMCASECFVVWLFVSGVCVGDLTVVSVSVTWEWKFWLWDSGGVSVVNHSCLQRFQHNPGIRFLVIRTLE